MHNTIQYNIGLMRLDRTQLYKYVEDVMVRQSIIIVVGPISN